MSLFLDSLPRRLRGPLQAAAVPRWCSAELLGRLLGNPRRGAPLLPDLAALPCVEPGEFEGTIRVTPDEREQLLAALEREQPMRYWRLLQRAHAYFVIRARLTHGVVGAACRDEAMWCADRLFFTALALHRPGDLAAVLARSRLVPGLAPLQEQQLDYYEAVMQGELYHYEPARAILASLLERGDLDTRLRARVLNSAGIFARRQGLGDIAIRYLEQARRAWAALDDELGAAKAAQNLGAAYYWLAEYELAVSLLHESIDSFRALNEPGLAARSFNDLGLTYRDLGRWSEALICFEQCLATWEGRYPGETVGVYNNMGEVNHFLGRYDEARAMYRRAAGLMDAHGFVDLDVPINLAFLDHTQGRLAEARDGYERALQHAEQAQDDDRRSLIYYRLGDLAERQGNLAAAEREYRRAVEIVEAMRGRVESEPVKISLLGARQQIYHALVLLYIRTGDEARAFYFSERARSRAFLDVLAARDPALAGGAADTVLTLAEVQAALSPDAVLVEYFTTGVVERGENILNRLPAAQAGLRDYLLPPARTLAFVVTRDAAHVREMPISPNGLRPGEADALPGPRFLEPVVRRRLCAALIEPLSDMIRDRRLLYLVPHGPLHYVPFAALTAADGEPFLRAGSPEIAIVPSATVLFRHCWPASRRAPEPCLALGYDGPGVGSRAQLTHAEAEARAVAEITGGTALAGPEPKADVLFETGDRYRRLHLSCHGSFDAVDPLASSLQLSAGESLTALDVLARLRLRAELVTLSACGSGAGRVMRGDEVLGLARAFIVAGTPALVCTLWHVEEISTRILMERFYRELTTPGGGRNKAAALHRAQLYLRDLTAAGVRGILAGWSDPGPAPFDSHMDDSARVFADPYFWAAFVLIGNPL